MTMLMVYLQCSLSFQVRQFQYAIVIRVLQCLLSDTGYSPLGSMRSVPVYLYFVLQLIFVWLDEPCDHGTPHLCAYRVCWTWSWVNSIIAHIRHLKFVYTYTYSWRRWCNAHVGRHTGYNVTSWLSRLLVYRCMSHCMWLRHQCE